MTGRNETLQQMADRMGVEPKDVEKVLRQELAAAYGAGQVKQALIAGEYPPPDLLGDLKPTGGTVTGRFSSKHPPYHEIPRVQMPKRLHRKDDVPEHLAEIDFSKIEDRIMTNMRDDAASKWAGIDKRTLSEFDQARRFVDLYSMGPSKLGVPVAVPAAQYWAQLEAASKTMIEWAAQMRAAGYEPGEGAAHDTWEKKRSVINLGEMLKAAGIDESQRVGWEIRIAKDGYIQSETDRDIWTKEDE